MIRCDKLIRLHKKDVDRLSKISGATPKGINTVDDLNNFVDQHLSGYDDSTPEAKLLGMLLADEKINPET